MEQNIKDKGNGNGLICKGACYQVRGPKFNAQDPYGGKELTPPGCPLVYTGTHGTHTPKGEMPVNLVQPNVQR